MIQPVILCGGSGSRLWPLSREFRPKQVIAPVGERTLFQSTAERVAADGFQAPFLVGNRDQDHLIESQLAELGIPAGLRIVEPFGRNTAPAIALAALSARRGGQDPVLYVMPSDHVIEDVEELHAACERAAQAARSGALVTFGIRPHRAETGYGYIEVGGSTSTDGVSEVVRFVEKPDLATAEGYVADGRHLWNSGMFMFLASRYLEELARLRPDIHEAALRTFEASTADDGVLTVDPESFEACPSESVDYAVLEQAGSVVVVPLGAGWSDVGSWVAVSDLHPKDESGNASSGDVTLVDVKDSFVRAEHRLVAAVGVEGLVVVETADAVLVTTKDACQGVKQVVTELKDREREEVTFHREVDRPWGTYDSIEAGSGYKVKRIVVKPRQKLSLQSHQQRDEHWVVIRGQGRVTLGEDGLDLAENQSVFIPRGTKHRMENPTDEPLEFIEVQYGGYLGEDDIERFEDIYGRT